MGAGICYKVMDKLINCVLVLMLVAVILYSVKGCYNLVQARECMKVAPPDGWSVICGVE